jgi:gliding motility-associated-like protein
MKKLFTLVLAVCCLQNIYSQADNCSGAITLAVTANCSSPIAGSTAGFTQNIPGCVGNADDDGWYKFVATATSHSITVTGSASFDPVLEVFSGTCASLVSLTCMDNTFSGQAEAISLTGLSIGVTYYVRVFHYGVGSGSSAFTICLTNPPPPPANDGCAGAINLSVNTSCSNTSGTTFGATQSLLGCAGTADDDVWFKFTANSYTQTITMSGGATMDGVVELYSGSCASLVSLNCMDNTFTGGIETINAVGLNPGSVYYIRVYDYYTAGSNSFSICVVGSPIGGGQPNDNPCSAIQLPAVTSSCNYLTFSTVGATNTGTGLAPTPVSCTGGSGGAAGFSAGSLDVWFKIIVPSNGNVYITPQPNLGVGYIADGSMALYSGACGALTQIACSSDYTLYPGSGNDLLPYVAVTGQTPGATLYLRYWQFGTGSGAFGICVQSPTNDNCANALYVCDINGYAGSTSAAYTPDRPGTGAGQMYANNETPTGVNQIDGTNTGGPFGYYPFPGTTAGPYSSPLIDVNIENNSWIKFTAANTSANLRVTVNNCWVGNYPTGGIQMQIFSASGCNNFVPVSSFKEGSSTFTVTAFGLTVGNDYYLMVDGYAKDICNYVIQALDGVAFPAIKALPDSICPGNSTVLTAPAGASAYDWFPGGQTTQTISVTPGSTQTFTCIASGVCGYKQTLIKQIIVKPLPVVAINSGATISTCGTQTNVLTASGATSYTWSTTQTTNTISVNPAVNTTYTLTGNTNGCISNTVTTITVNPIPNIITANTNTVCYGSAVTLTVSGGTSYTWTPGGTGVSISVSPLSNTVYNVTGVNAQGCTKVVSSSVTVIAKPSITANAVTICNGNVGTLTAGGGSTYAWLPSGTGVSYTASPSSTSNYTVIGTAANSCTNSAVGTISVNALPTISVSSSTICLNKTYTLSASGGNTYNWSTSQTGSSINVTPALTTVYSVTGTAVSTCTNVTTATVTVRGLPQMAVAPSIAPSNCSASTGSITAVNVTGAPTLTYSWTNSSSALVGTSPNLNSQPAGTYNLQVMDGNGCVNSFGPYSITNPGAPAAPSASATANSLCQGATISLTANGTGTYNWSGPNSFNTTTQNPTIPSATTLMSGVYSVFNTSAGCSGPATNVTVTVNALPNPSAIASQPSYCANDTIKLFGSTATTYTWSGPSSYSSNVQNPIIPNGVAGLYQLAVTNSNGCSNTTNVSIIVNSNPIATASNLGAVCANGTISLNAGGGSTYSWSGPNGFTSTLSSPTIPNAGTSLAGQYSVTVTNITTGCLAKAVTNVTVNALPTFTANASSANVCFGSPIQLNAGGSSITSYAWSGPNSFNSSIQNPSITPASSINTGNYTVAVTDGNGCSSNQIVNVNVYNQINVNASALANTVCSGNVANLLGTGGGSYAWVGPNSFSSANQNPTISGVLANASGIYTLTVTDVNNCTAKDTVRLLVNQTPIIISNAGDTTCTGGALTLSANFGVGTVVNWYSDQSGSLLLQGNSSTYNPTPAGNGVYTYYAQATLNGCTSTLTPVSAGYFNINAAASADVYNGNAPLSVNFTNGSTGVTPSDTYSWIFGDGSGTNTINPSHVFGTGGTYNVILTVTDDESGCSDTALVTIRVEDDLVIVVPNVFTPNGDGVNDLFHIKLTGAKSAEGFIYNRWGQLLYKWDVLNVSWDGKGSNGEDCPDANYFYIIKVIDNKDKKHEFPGYTLIIR